jgi:hypothetical protein
MAASWKKPKMRDGDLSQRIPVRRPMPRPQGTNKTRVRFPSPAPVLESSIGIGDSKVCKKRQSENKNQYRYNLIHGLFLKQRVFSIGFDIQATFAGTSKVE